MSFPYGGYGGGYGNYGGGGYGGGYGSGYGGGYGGGFVGVGGSGPYQSGSTYPPNYFNFPGFKGGTLGFNPIIGDQKQLPSGDIGVTFVGPGGGYAAVDLNGARSMGQAAAVRFNALGTINWYSNSATAFRGNNTNFYSW